MTTYEAFTPSGKRIQFESNKEITAVAIITDADKSEKIVSKTSTKQWLPSFDAWCRRMENEWFSYDVVCHNVRKVADANAFIAAIQEASIELAKLTDETDLAIEKCKFIKQTLNKLEIEMLARRS
jgi:hypothetical protein